MMHSGSLLNLTDFDKSAVIDIQIPTACEKVTRFGIKTTLTSQ